MIKIFIFLVLHLFVLAFGIPIFPPARNFSSSINTKRMNTKKLGNIFGDDMLFPTPLAGMAPRGVAVTETTKWPYGIIPYDISPITDAEDRLMIENAMHRIMYDTGSPIAGSEARESCVYFRPRLHTDTTYLTIVYGKGCSAHVGYWKNYPLKLTLQKSEGGTCFTSRIIQHELMHVLNFRHEHQRPDRDNYIQVHYDNIDSERYYDFEKTEWGTTATDLETNYDYDSILHYGVNDLSKNGLPTIVPKQIGGSNWCS
ncbi:unnamed protein product [Adineta ricciae]|uniref:Metalloendopeptidase n=1 Tax=Adineta ricciae TaxID=249248 RepID=A0A815GQ65_ADIRI|nr:unnamed protein product [Adineta ricciae]